MLEPLPASAQELAVRLRLREHDCDACGDKVATVSPIRSDKHPLWLRFVCRPCLDTDNIPALVAQDLGA